ncbi:hypothetical protein GWI33_022840 [Rhynchophorus ferrugineus]|uniref:Mannosyltransferase n=2 Tax=Eukaryota TaxID=2759 RepID=A0A834MKT4_RHYFE|nr:hypothetical protein GWI33_022840 [Rhynchophorus ferrugineus]
MIFCSAIYYKSIVNRIISKYHSLTLSMDKRETLCTLNNALKLLAALRIFLIFLPQNGYIHPDEYFQSVDVLAAKIFGVEHSPAWEFNTTFPIRGMTIPYFTTGMCFFFLRDINDLAMEYLSLNVVSPYFLLGLLLFQFSFGFTGELAQKEYSFYYGYLTWGEIGMLDVSIDNFVVTPLNFLKYNVLSTNLEKHGLHPRYLHFLINVPLLFNILGALALFKIGEYYYLIIQGKLNLLPSVKSIKMVMIMSFISPILMLSVFPHQEPRFIIPVILPLVYLHEKAADKLYSHYNTKYSIKKRVHLYERGSEELIALISLIGTIAKFTYAQECSKSHTFKYKIYLLISSSRSRELEDILQKSNVIDFSRYCLRVTSIFYDNCQILSFWDYLNVIGNLCQLTLYEIQFSNQSTIALT